MPVLLPDDTPPAPPAAIARAIQIENRSGIRSEIETFRRIFLRLWGSTAATAQEIFDEFDTDGGALIDVIQARLDFIEAVAIANGQTLDDYIGEDERTPPLTATVNMDGTVTVT